MIVATIVIVMTGDTGCYTTDLGTEFRSRGLFFFFFFMRAGQSLEDFFPSFPFFSFPLAFLSFSFFYIFLDRKSVV